jgi:alpha-1,3-rhamnosyl/mannosyltransferase
VSAAPPPVLLVTGYPTAFEAELRRQAGDRVRFAGWVDDATLEGLYRLATCLAFPSLAEGFGLPVLEAMRRGVPVACSNATSLPEVAGEAALYFDPTDTVAIATALERILEDAGLRERLATAGVAQAGKFSWEATAAATLESYERALA